MEDEGSSVLQVLGERGNIGIIDVRKLADFYVQMSGIKFWKSVENVRYLFVCKKIFMCVITVKHKFKL